MNQYSESFSKAYAKLNPNQRLAVDCIEGPVMVIAGPGTGKTQILSLRIAKILHDKDLQALPQNILCLTFTDSGLVAMRKRLSEFIGNQAYLVNIHTFHSFCNEIIKNNPDKFYLNTQIDDLDQIQIFREIIDGLEPDSPLKSLGQPYYYAKDLQRLITTSKREFISPEKIEFEANKFNHWIQINYDLIDSFVAIHGGKLKSNDYEAFLDQLIDEECKNYFRNLYQLSVKGSDFKKNLQDIFKKQKEKYAKQIEFIKAYKAYNAKLKEHGLYDYEDMILSIIDAFNKYPELLSDYQERYHYILVDEYQDTNGSQNQILELLTNYYKDNSNIFVVGDDDQSIYRFQGASIENIIYFYQRHSNNLSSFVLDYNYRSQQNILDLANILIENNQGRISKLIPSIAKNLKAQNSNLELSSIKIFNCPDPYSEVYLIAKAIKDLISKGTNPEQIAILYRENKDANLLQNCLQSFGIHSSSKSNNDILKNLQILQLLDLIKVISNPRTYSYLIFNLLNYDFIFQSKLLKGISRKTIFQIIGKFRKEKQDSESLIEFLSTQEIFNTWANKIIEFNQKAINYRLTDFLAIIVQEFGYLEYILQTSERIEANLALGQLFREVDKFYDRKFWIFKNPKLNNKISLNDLINHFDLLIENKIALSITNIEINSVKLMTAHKSKGLEFDYVFIYAANDKIWGNKSARSAIKLPATLIATDSLINPNEDERRLFYVALTRAKKEVHIYRHLKDINHRDTLPSQFVIEIKDSNLIEENEVKLNPEELLESQSWRFTKQGNLNLDQYYLTNIIENYQLSVTHLNNYLKCKRKFFYQNLLRVPSSKSLKACLGTAIHEALSNLFTILKNTQLNLPDAINLAKQSCKTNIANQNLSEEEKLSLEIKGLKILEDYIENNFSRFYSNSILDYDFSGFNLSFKGTKITGKLDKIDIIQDKQIRVIDYKTGSVSKFKPGDDSHRQIVFYRFLSDLAKKAGLFNYEMTEGVLEFVEKNDSGKYRSEIIHVTNEDLINLEAEIETMIQGLKEGDFAMTEDLQECSFCQFKNICSGS